MTNTLKQINMVFTLTITIRTVTAQFLIFLYFLSTQAAI